MSTNEPREVNTRRDIERDFRRLEQRYQTELRNLLQQAREEGIEERYAERLADAEREAEQIREEAARDTREVEAARARRDAPAKILLLLLLFLVLFLFAVATGRPDIISFPRTRDDSLNQTLSTNGANTHTAPPAGQGSVNNGDIPPVGTSPTTFYPVGDRFREYYDRNGGERIFGRGISPVMQVNGRTIQWFERTRLEDWPENAGTPYDIQSGRVGVEFTKGIEFPNQTYFVSQPGMRYFAETNHGVRNQFLQFWEQNGGLDLLGFPIGDEVQERLPDGKVYTVQYFERARLEYHPEHAGSIDEMQIGLLGTALRINNSHPDIIKPVAAPTPVPLPRS